MANIDVRNSFGYGIKSIKYTVKKYNGWVTIDTKDNWFKLNVVIPLPRED